MNYYEILGVDRNATPEDIKKAYRRLASKNHPDKGGDTQKFQEIQTAYDTLSNPERRAQYDAPRQNQNFQFNFGEGGPNLDEVFRQFGFRFGGDPFQGFRQAARRNKDVKIEIALDLSDTLQDQNKTLNIKTPNNSGNTITITIPRGVTAGTVIKYPSLGDNLFANLPPGDLLVAINIRPHDQFQAQGLDLQYNLTISCFEAIIGCKREITGLDGKQFVLSIPPGCQPGTRLKIPGEGLYAFQKDVKGNLYIQVNVSIPINLTDDQKQIIQTLTTNS